jgi:hypothetical protein
MISFIHALGDNLADLIMMVTTIIPLHERLGTQQGYLGIEPLAMGEIGIAEEQIAYIRCPNLSEGLGPQALCDSQLEGLRFVLDNLDGQRVFREVTGLVCPGNVGPKVVARDLASSSLSSFQRGFICDLPKDFQDMVFSQFFAELLQHRDDHLEGEIKDLLKGHVRVFQKLVLGDSLSIHDT